MAAAVASHRRFASLDEAAEYLGVNPRTVRRLIADGRITGYRLGPKLLRVDLAELESSLTRVPTAGGDVA